MKKDWTHLEKHRTQNPPYTSHFGDHFGAFAIKNDGIGLCIIAVDSEGTGWEHVSVHCYDPVFKMSFTPTWKQMSFVKDLFWEEDEVVFQFHPAKADHINLHEHVLHLWKPVYEPIPMPPKICV